MRILQRQCHSLVRRQVLVKTVKGTFWTAIAVVVSIILFQFVMPEDDGRVPAPRIDSKPRFEEDTIFLIVEFDPSGRKIILHYNINGRPTIEEKVTKSPWTLALPANKVNSVVLAASQLTEYTGYLACGIFIANTLASHSERDSYGQVRCRI